MITALRAEQQIEAAHSAFTASQDVAPEVRASWLEAIAVAFEDHADELIALAQSETHLGEHRLSGELRRTVFQLRLYISEILAGENLDATIDHADGAWGMGPRPDIRRVNIPLGVVGVFGASNFPFAFSVLGGDTASALAAGCAVVHKIHDGHPELGLRMGEVAIEALRTAGAPEHLLSTVTGRDAAEALVDHPLTRAVGFTGSTGGGRALLDRIAARDRPIPFYGELGSINPVFATERAWALRGDEILTAYAQSFTMGMGQFCTKPGLLFAPTDREQVARVMGTQVAQGQRTPLLSAKLRAGFDAALEKMCATDGIEVVVAGDSAESPAPTVLLTTAAFVRADPAILEREMFGPATLVICYEPGEDLADLAALLDGQLTASVQAQAEEDIDPLLAVLREKSGRVLWNEWPTGVTVSYAQHHGGPYPATTAERTTSVGPAAIARFMRPVAFQGFPPAHLPLALQDENPWRISRRVDGHWQHHDHGAGSHS
ncbi:aldehyde dehydrogenase (NADP(+)) [Cryobacterium sp. TMT1-2-2]|uniref:aldehyde dehydrogenase (NADP(+)) n=1 Tax=Cryobacterium sp. TMT1-2-2 TaxID=1259233 RepID=UPI00106933F3|nr:aldehyde dehydrogenase (NADP(+)) [Cryobacterium sp. TMT1-2-2]TFD09763.1 aldehyde dehydrogenase (NADP(+)) [Cryobacterium sp. TMT1-2-2]